MYAAWPPIDIAFNGSMFLVSEYTHLSLEHTHTWCDICGVISYFVEINGNPLYVYLVFEIILYKLQNLLVIILTVNLIHLDKYSIIILIGHLFISCFMIVLDLS